jgi:hypothetical protein
VILFSWACSLVLYILKGSGKAIHMKEQLSYVPCRLLKYRLGLCQVREHKCLYLQIYLIDTSDMSRMFHHRALFEIGSATSNLLSRT